MESEKLNELLCWWDNNYNLIADYNLLGRKIIGDKNNKKCRFCGKTEPEVTFKDIAHAIPASLNNKYLFSYYECDSCNHKFGDTIEDQLNKYLFPQRLASIILGRKGKITYKEDDLNRIEVTDGNWKVQETFPHFITRIDDHNIQINVKRDTYIPIMVYKAFVKMAITIMPEEELVYMSNTIEWLQSNNKSIEDYFGKYVIMRFFPGLNKFPFIKLSVFKKKHEEALLPEYQFLIAFSNYSYQIIVPCIEKDKILNGTTCSLKGFPTPFDFSACKEVSSHALLDLSNHNPVENEKAPIMMHFEKEELKFEL